MRELVLTPKFTRSFRKFVKKNPQLENKIIETLTLMKEDVFIPQLSSHSLQGKLLGLKACSCGYNCRIIFTLETDQNNQEMVQPQRNIFQHKMI